MKDYYVFNHTTKEVINFVGNWAQNNIEIKEIINIMDWDHNDNIGLYNNIDEPIGLTDNFEKVDLYDSIYVKKYINSCTLENI